MSEMVERVLKAMAAEIEWQAQDGPIYIPQGGMMLDDRVAAIDGSVDLEQVARAAIEAMREPTEGMVRQAYALPDRLCGNCHIETETTFGEGESHVGAEDVWAAMIEAALARSP